MLIFLFLILPGLVCLYAMAVRPLLHKIPALSKFYDEADGFWQKCWAMCGKSVTMLWGHIITFCGILFKGLDYIGPIVGDPDMKGQIVSWLQKHPSVLAYGVMAMGAITVAARMRSVLKAG